MAERVDIGEITESVQGVLTGLKKLKELGYIFTGVEWIEKPEQIGQAPKMEPARLHDLNKMQKAYAMLDMLGYMWTERGFQKRGMSAEETAMRDQARALMKQYPHYYKDVSHLQVVDVYRVLDLFKVEHPCVQHAAKKLLVSGQRGFKDSEQDIREAMDSLKRALQMIAEG